MEKKFYYKLWQKNEIEAAATLDFIKSIGNAQTQIMDSKIGWLWLPDIEKQVNKK